MKKFYGKIWTVSCSNKLSYNYLQSKNPNSREKGTTQKRHNFNQHKMQSIEYKKGTT